MGCRYFGRRSFRTFFSFFLCVRSTVFMIFVFRCLFVGRVSLFVLFEGVIARAGTILACCRLWVIRREIFKGGFFN